MTNDSKKSESPILATKSANKAAMTAAESMERRGDTKGNASTTNTRRTQRRESVSSGLARVRQIAKAQPKLRFTALMHHLTTDLLRQSYFWLKRNAAPGVDGVTWEAYGGEQLDEKIADLHARVHRGAYRALPSRRKMIPKPDGRERPLGIASLEDKIVQRAMVEILNEIYEVDFLGFSYGFRPGRGQHDALDALAYAITHTPVRWILDADLRAYFDTVNHEWLIRFLDHRIGDPQVIRLIRKWLQAGVMDGLNLVATTRGTPQGSVISPLLANVYLHYCFDLWIHSWRKKRASGNVFVVRYADDLIVGLQYHDDATALRSELETRLGKFSLTLHPEKTRLIEFGRWAHERRQKRGKGKPEPFAFLGSFISARRLVQATSNFAVRLVRTACGLPCTRFGNSYANACTSRWNYRGVGSKRLCEDTLRITPCRQTVQHSVTSGTELRVYGGTRSQGVVRTRILRGARWPLS